MSVFQPVASRVDFPALERGILQFWKDTSAFKKRVAKNRGKAHWTFIDGPITANNPMGVHHAWGRTYKDLWQRYKAMQGYDQIGQNGFDCQGLWVEVEVEKELGFNNKRDIEAFGIAPFVAACKQRVLRFSAIQTEQSVRLGMWADWNDPQELRLFAEKLGEDPDQKIAVNGPNGPVTGSVEQIISRLGLPELGGSYFTFSDENNYSIWHFLKKCNEQGWIYKGHDVMPWCPRCSTGLSDMEIATEGYEEIIHPGIFLRFPLRHRTQESLLVWTTTPWTLTSNVAAAVHPELPYVRVQQGDELFYLAKAALPVLKGEHRILDEFPGERLDGLIYQSPFDELPPQKGVEHRVILWKEVSETEGTGIVHIAPGCGKEDFRLSKEHNLAVIAPLDEFGVFLDGFAWLSGRNVGEVAQPIIEDLHHKGILYRVEDYRHRYPVCWRCHTQLVFRLVDEWFISMDELRSMLMEVTKKIRWIPDFGLERELDWLRNMSDWMISKKRYWGLALPIYECRHGHFEVVGSEHELQVRAMEGWDQFRGHSPHRPWIDAVKIRLKECGEVASRIPDVGNPWLDAGIVTFSTLRYRQDRGYWEDWFPAKFITESFPGQYRNWFYALLVMSTVLENRPPFLTVLGHGTVRDEKGEEMHKSKGNLILFDEAAEKAGVDVMRWMYALQPPESNLNFGYRLADEVRRRFFIPFWNVYSFFVTYAQLDGWTPQKSQVPSSPLGDLDRWILSRLHSTLRIVTNSLDNYDAATASRAIEFYVEDLSNWYVRRSRRRFWKSEQDADKKAAYSTLYQSLVTLCKMLAPFTPFLAEEMYQNLVRSIDSQVPESVHHNDWPQADESLIDEELMADFALVIRLVRLGHAARNKAGIKVRQPLAEAVVVTKDPEENKVVERLASLLLEELNVKKLSFAGSFAEKEGYATLEESGYVVGLNIVLTPQLLREGMARELVRQIQDLRKKSDFQISDRILTYYLAEGYLQEVIANEGAYIRHETLSERLIAGEAPLGAAVGQFEINGQKVAIGLVHKTD